MFEPEARFPSHSQRPSLPLQRGARKVARPQGLEPTPGGICVNLSHYLLKKSAFHKQEELSESRVYAEAGAKLQRVRGGSTVP